jgi:hypothetical protein
MAYRQTRAVTDPTDKLRATNALAGATEAGHAHHYQHSAYNPPHIGGLAQRDDASDLWEPWLGGQGTVGACLAGLDSRKRGLIEHHTRQAYLVGEPDVPRSIAATAWVVRGTAQ